MATVHTAYGPGRIIAQETVRGRTQYKVAGDGFEVWLDEAKLGGYEPSGGVDLDAPHWQGYDLGDTLTGEAFGPPADDDVSEYADPRGHFDRNRMRTHDDYDGFGDEASHYGRLAWAPLDTDNSTELPYNPDPQHDARGFSGDDGSATLQPIHNIDADERLHPSDSITFEDEGDEYDGPGPSPDNFARSAAHDLMVNHPLVRKVFDALPLNPEVKEMALGAGTGHTVNKAVNHLNNQTSQIIDTLSPGAGWGDLIKDGSRHEAILPLILPALGAAGEMLAGGEAGAALAGAAGRAGAGAAARGLAHGAEDAVDNFNTGGPNGGWGDLVKDGSYRPAGLSDRYIDLTASVDYHNDPVAQFRHDPDAYINRIGQIMDEGLNPRFAEYMDLVEADSGIRTAAWKDVRKKAMRLKREGHVTVKDIAPTRIMASVVGDHGTYDVLILKGASFGGLNEGNPGHSIANWHCGCEWGKWAFRRKFSYVGRLCSHAYASYLTMQSAALKGKPRQQWRVKEKAPARSLPFLHVKRADALQNGTERLTPDMVVNDTDDAQMFVDVTKDERKDVGPDDVVSEKDIVHFARLMRHCEVTEQPYPRQLVAFLARYAKESDDTQKDWEAPHTEDAEPALNKLRNFADGKQSGDFGDMADRVHRIQDAVEDARDNGVDASQFVAAVRRLAAPTVPGPNTEVLNTGPNDGLRHTVVEPKAAPLAGGNTEVLNTGPNDGLRHTVVEPGQEGGQKTFNDASGAAGQRSGDQLTINRTGLPSNERSDAQKAINRTNIDTNTFDPAGYPVPAGAPKPGENGFAGLNPTTPGSGSQSQSPTSKGTSSGTPSTAPGSAQNVGLSGTGGGGVGGGGAMTSGPVSDGGKAGAENGNNSAIGAGQLDKDGYYTVQKGDTLSDIAQRSYGDMNKYQDIAKGNNISNPDVINEGQRIKIDNPTGNGGMSGDVTTPGGSSKAMAGPAAATTDAIAPPANPAGNTPGDTSGSSGTGSGTLQGGQSVTDPGLTPAPATQPAQAPAAPLAAEAGGAIKPQSSRQRWAAPSATNQSYTSDPNQSPENTTSTSTTAKPGASTATKPSKPGGTTPTSPTSLPTAQPGGTNTSGAGTGTGVAKTPQVGPSQSSDTYDPNDPAQSQQQRQQGTGGSGFDTPSSGGGFGGSDALSTGIGAAGDIASGLGNALPGIAQGVSSALPGMASGIGSAISGIASGLGGILGSASASSSIFASREDFDDWARYAYPEVGDKDSDFEPHAHPFAGSGYPGPLEIGTSEEYADKARAKHDDVTDLGDDPLSTPMGEWQRQSSLDVDDDGPYREASYDGYATDDASDIVRSFQANLDGTALGAGAGGGGGRYDDIASAAQGFLRTAGRNYSLSEQSELIREGDKGGARNLDSLDLTGTHYEDMHTLGW